MEWIIKHLPKSWGLYLLKSQLGFKLRIKILIASYSKLDHCICIALIRTLNEYFPHFKIEENHRSVDIVHQMFRMDHKEAIQSFYADGLLYEPWWVKPEVLKYKKEYANYLIKKQ